MTYRHPLDAPFRMQWDSDSRLPRPDPGTAPSNCGCTCVAMLAQYYRDAWSGIYATRRLAVTNDSQPFTSINQQSLMLARRGVPNHVSRPSVAGITSILSSGRRPVMIGMDMSQVPLGIAGHPFRGSHAVLLRANAVQGGVAGKLVADPNFSRVTKRLDPTNGRRFYPDWVIQRAYYNAGKWALVPDKAKFVTAPAPTPPVTSATADGDPYPMRYRSLIAESGMAPSYRIRAGKPIRRGALTTSPTWQTVTMETHIRTIGYIPKADLPPAEQVYGDVLLIEHYQTNGYHLGYVKKADIA